MIEGDGKQMMIDEGNDDDGDDHGYWWATFGVHSEY